MTPLKESSNINSTLYNIFFLWKSNHLNLVFIELLEKYVWIIESIQANINLIFYNTNIKFHS